MELVFQGSKDELEGIIDREPFPSLEELLVSIGAGYSF
jgi:hypothetical protein